MSLKSSEVSTNNFAGMVREFSEIKAITFVNSKIMLDPCWDRKIEFKKIESIAITNLSIPLNMFEVKSIKKFMLKDVGTQISPTVLALTACNIAEQKALEELIIDINIKVDILECFSEINHKLAALKKLMVRVSGAWNIKHFIEIIDNNKASLKFIGVTLVDDDTPTLEMEDAINSMLTVKIF